MRNQSLKHPKRLLVIDHIVIYLQKYPVRFPALGFLLFITLGILLFSMPFTHGQGSLTTTEALFTAVSASCITGLSVIDVGTRLSIPGQVILLFLIQCGALGIMTFSIGIMNLWGSKSSFLQQRLIRNTFGDTSTSTHTHTVSILKKVFLYTIIIEIIGAIALLPTFLQTGMSAGKAIYFAIFHSISGFCNAGFCLFPDSLMQFQGHYFMNFLMIFLIICGGLGFMTLSQVKDFIKYNIIHFLNKSFYRKRSQKKTVQFSLQTKIILLSTTILTVLGFVFIAAVEWNYSLSEFSTADKLLRSLFQSVTTRSSGFNTMDISALNNSALFFIIVLMFIGASPGSCGGGIKVTTFAILINMAIARFLGQKHTHQFKKSIPSKNIDQAIRLIIVFFSFATLLLIVMFTLEPNIPFRDIVFESISALTTCGLSTGISANLSDSSKIVLCVAMYIGRLGPLALATAFSMNEKESFYYSEEEIMVG